MKDTTSNHDKKSLKYKIFKCVSMTIFYSLVYTLILAISLKFLESRTNDIDKSVYLEFIISEAERKYSIPSGLLYAIAASESNFRKYAVGVKGKSTYYKSLNEAKNYAKSIIKSGITNIDIGVMQINWHWHKGEFLNLDEMFSPERNIDYAAKFLLSLKNQYGSWKKAIRYYNSSNPKYNEKYYRKVISNWKKFIIAKQEDEL